MFGSMFSGRVLNRFSKDVGFLDDLLPYHYSDFSVVSTVLYKFYLFICIVYF